MSDNDQTFEDFQELWHKLQDMRKEDPDQIIERMIQQAQAQMYSDAYTLAWTFAWDELRGRDYEDAAHAAMERAFFMNSGDYNLAVQVPIPVLEEAA